MISSILISGEKPLVQQAWILAQRYDAVVANPPYMGSKGMNAELKKFAKKNYPNSKSDLFAIFMEHGFSLLNEAGFNAQINMQSWMFLSSYEKLREWLLDSKTFVMMAHLGARAFSQISGEVVQTTAWVLSKKHIEYYQPVFFRLIEGNEEEKQQALLNQKKRFDGTQQDDFKKIPGSPIAYWVSDRWFDLFRSSKNLGEISDVSEGIKTGNNDKFLRQWHEVNYSHIGDIKKLNVKWVYHHKGGEFRRWSGNQEFVILWENEGNEIKLSPNSGLQGINNFYRNSAIWSDITSGGYSARIKCKNHLFDSASPSGSLIEETDFGILLGYLNSKIVDYLTPILNPTLHFKVGNYRALPFKRVGIDIEEPDYLRI